MQFALHARNPAKVSDSYHLTETLDIFVRTMAILIINVPISRGLVFGNSIKTTVVELLKGIATMFNSSLEQPVTLKNPQEYLYSSFNVIPFACNKLLRLPINNIQALSRKWEEWLEMLQETLNELERLVDDSGLFDFDERVFELERDNLTEEDRAMMKRCAALIKVTRILIRKILVRKLHSITFFIFLKLFIYCRLY